MKKILTTAAFVALAFAQPALAENNIGEKAHSAIINNMGKVIGSAQYTQGNEGVIVEVNVKDLPAGKHGMHFHEVGLCENHSNFKMAKGHIKPTGKPHGYLYPQGPHEGDLPNLIVAKDGTAHVELYTDFVSISGRGGKPALLDDNGSTLMIHTNPDDYTTQPIGGSGARIACGVVEATK